LSIAKYYIQPSIILNDGSTEGFGLAVLEAMWLGATALVTNVGGLPEAVGDDKLVFDDAKGALRAILSGEAPLEKLERLRAHVKDCRVDKATFQDIYNLAVT
jgi:glycosyltransferase involved in cell wall biosynthesis